VRFEIVALMGETRGVAALLTMRVGDLT